MHSWSLQQLIRCSVRFILSIWNFVWFWRIHIANMHREEWGSSGPEQLQNVDNKPIWDRDVSCHCTSLHCGWMSKAYVIIHLVNTLKGYKGSTFFMWKRLWVSRLPRKNISLEFALLWDVHLHLMMSRYSLRMSLAARVQATRCCFPSDPSDCILYFGTSSYWNFEWGAHRHYGADDWSCIGCSDNAVPYTFQGKQFGKLSGYAISAGRSSC